MVINLLEWPLTTFAFVIPFSSNLTELFVMEKYVLATPTFKSNCTNKFLSKIIDWLTLSELPLVLLL